MTTSAAELAELRGALRRALGSAPDAVPAPDPEWRARWPLLAELGVLAFCVPEERGGFGNEVEAALVASRELGAALHGSPYAAAVAATAALARSLDPGILEAVLAGEHLPVLAFLDPGSEAVDTVGGLRLHGRARLVAGADECDAFVLTARDRRLAAHVDDRVHRQVLAALFAAALPVGEELPELVGSACRDGAVDELAVGGEEVDEIGELRVVHEVAVLGEYPPNRQLIRDRDLVHARDDRLSPGARTLPWSRLRRRRRRPRPRAATVHGP